DQSRGKDRESGFAADGMDHLGFGVDSTHAANLLEITRGSLLEDCVAVVGVAAIFGFESFVVQLSDDFGKSHFIRLADAHIDDLRAGIGSEGGPFGPFDLLEFIDGGGFAVLLSTNAFSEQILDIGLDHRISAAIAVQHWDIETTVDMI